MSKHQIKQYAITGIGVIGRFGTGIEDLKKRIHLDYSGGLEDFHIQPDLTGSPTSEVKTDCLNRFLPAHKLRRTDHFSKLAIAALFLALDSCDLKPEDCQNSAVIVATGYGPVASTCAFKKSYFDNGPSGASPMMFTKSVQNQTAAHIAMLLDMRGPVLTVCQHTLPFQHALLQACTLLDEQKADRVIIGGVDEYTDFLDYCCHRYKEKTDKTSNPAQGNRFSTFTGEGASFFILENPTAAGNEPAITCPAITRISPGESIAAPPGTICSNYWKEHEASSEIIDFNAISGGFPSSASFDLAAATLLPRIKRRLLIETVPNGLVARMNLLHNELIV